MKLHTTRSLYEKWEIELNKKKARVEKLKEREHDRAAYEEREELYAEMAVIRELLADVGLMVYAEERKTQAKEWGAR